MIQIKLLGSPTCRRYQKMRACVVKEVERLKVGIQFEEIADIETLSQFNLLSLPRLFIGGDLVASQNPPEAEKVRELLNRISVSDLN